MNATVVFCVPMGVVVVFLLFVADVHVPRPLNATFFRLRDVAIAFTLLLPLLLVLALISGWRTWSYAKAYLEGRSKGWVGVLEAAGVGFGFTFLALLNGILKRHPDAMTALVSYGRIAIAVGLVVGVVLRLVAILVLKLNKQTDGVGAGSEHRSVA